MRVLLVTDVHGEVDRLRSIVEPETFDAVLCAGDLSDAAWYDEYAGNLASVLDVLERCDGPAWAVPGNTDPEGECVSALRARGMNLHGEVRSTDRFVAAGYGGGVGRTDQPFDPDGEEIRDAMLALCDELTDHPRAAVVHQPPAETALDVTERGSHVGEPAVRELFARTDFDLAVTGHIHESRGRDEIAGTPVVNPGAVLDGRYAVAEFDGRTIEVELKEL